MKKKVKISIDKSSNKFLIFLVLLFLATTIAFAYLWITEYPSPLSNNSNNESTDSTLIKNSDNTYTKVLSSSACSNLEVYYLDLKNNNGETKIGDSTYIKCDNIDIVIDAGIKNVGTTTVVPFLKEKVTDKVIDLVIITHTDNDHIGGFIGLSNKEGVLSINDFTYKYILESGYSADSKVYEELMTLANSKNATVCTAYDSIKGNNNCAKNFKMGNITLDIIDTSMYNSNTEPNDRSVVTLLTYNEVNFLFPGDLLNDTYLASKLGHVDIFKASHHGASSANSQTLLNAITPEVIILSTDGDNSYGIPQQECLDVLYSKTENIYATFTTGTIKISTNGDTYNIEADNLVLFQNTDWFIENRD